MTHIPMERTTDDSINTVSGQLRSVTDPVQFRQILNKYLESPKQSWIKSLAHLFLQLREDPDHIVAFVLANNVCLSINYPDAREGLAFEQICSKGWIKSAKLLIRDRRVELNIRDFADRSPLYYAISDDQVDIIRFWIASGRKMDLTGILEDTNLFSWRTRGVGTYYEWIKEELEQFQANPEKTRHRVRLELGEKGETEFLETAAAEIFALVVFLCDGLLKPKLPGPGLERAYAVHSGRVGVKDTDADRFFKIASELPLELQQILCLRAVGSAKRSIASGASEKAFRQLAKRLVVVWHRLPQDDDE